MFYPKLPSDIGMSLNLLVQFTSKDPAYLNAKECTYDDTLKGLIRQLVDVKTGVVEYSEEELNVDNINLDSQIVKTLLDLDQMSQQIGKLEPNEKLALFKTRTALIEKLISMQERVRNLREVNAFRGVVMEAMDRVMTKDQVSDFMSNLKLALTDPKAFGVE